jgi:hypothetical protein
MGFFSKLFPKKGAAPVAVTAGELVIDLSRVVPRVKAVYGEETIDPGPGPGGSGEHLEMTAEDSPVMAPLTTGLSICYAMDMGNRYQLIQNRHLTDAITQAALHGAALSNMAREIADKTEVNGDPAAVMMLTNGGNFEAAMLLVDGMWENLRQVFKDDLCVAVPARDLLFIAGRNSGAGREGLRALVRKYFDEQQTKHLLVRHIYGRENDGWVKVETA